MTSVSNPVYISLNLDDLLAAEPTSVVKRVKKQLVKRLTETDLGPCIHFLGIQIVRPPNGIFLTQSAYVQTVVDSKNMRDAKPATSPLPLAHPSTIRGGRQVRPNDQS